MADWQLVMNEEELLDDSSLYPSESGQDARTTEKAGRFWVEDEDFG